MNNNPSIKTSGILLPPFRGFHVRISQIWACPFHKDIQLVPPKGWFPCLCWPRVSQTIVFVTSVRSNNDIWFGALCSTPLWERYPYWSLKRRYFLCSWSLKQYVGTAFWQRNNALGASFCQWQSSDNNRTLSPTLWQRKRVTGSLFFIQNVHQTILSCSNGSKSSSLAVGGVSSSLPGRGVLMWTPASEDIDALLSGWGLSLRDSWGEEEELEGFSGMKRATMKAMTTVHAPSRKGGPGMRPRWEREKLQRKMFPVIFSSFIWSKSKAYPILL